LVQPKIDEQVGRGCRGHQVNHSVFVGGKTTFINDVTHLGGTRVDILITVDSKRILI
jgi:hypothetical protein